MIKLYVYCSKIVELFFPEKKEMKINEKAKSNVLLDLIQHAKTNWYNSFAFHFFLLEPVSISL